MGAASTEYQRHRDARKRTGAARTLAARKPHRPGAGSVDWRRPQFSLLFLLLVTVYAAGMLHLHMHVAGVRPDVSDLARLTLNAVLLYGCAYWLITASSPGFRVFLLWLLVGAGVDFGALCLWHANEWVEYTTGEWLPQGWFPAAFPVERGLKHFGLCAFQNAAARSIAGGMLITGLACGTFAVLIWRLATKARWSMVRPITRLDSTAGR